jgi:hypothetical protein
MVFQYWKSISELAEAFGVKYSTAQSWLRRGYIPAEYDYQRIKMITALGVNNVEVDVLLKSFSDERNFARTVKFLPSQ